MKYHIITTNPGGVIEGYSNTFLLTPHKTLASNDWAWVGEVEFDPASIDMNEVRRAAVKGIDAEMERRRADFLAGLEELKTRRESLLAIDHKGE